MKKKNGQKRNYISVSLVLLVMTLIVAGLVVLTFFEMKRYEEGILDVCATQQDSYVQLVIDQINLKENRTDQEIIESILSTLDSSSNRYWTFSKQQTMLYVKDALETNRYQALTADSYYTTDSANVFIDDLMLNKVIHERIELEGKDYIASGALFEYGGDEYRICLLTNTTVLLDNNKFLGSKEELIILFIIIYSVIFILPIVMTIIHNRLKKKILETSSDLNTVNASVERLNELLSVSDIYDNRKNLFRLSNITLFLDEFREQRKAFPIAFIAVRYAEKETVAKFFGKNSVALGRKDIKLYDGKLHLALILCVRCNVVKAKEIAASLKGDHEVLGIEVATTQTMLDSKFEKVMHLMGDPPLDDSMKGKVMRPDSRTESRYRAKEEEKNAQ